MFSYSQRQAINWMRARKDKIANSKTLEIKQWIWVLKAGQKPSFFFHLYILITDPSMLPTLSLIFIFFLSILTIHFVCCLFSGVLLLKQIYVLGYPCICWGVRKHHPWHLYLRKHCNDLLSLHTVLRTGKNLFVLMMWDINKAYNWFKVRF